MRVLATGADHTCGGMHVDELLVEYFLKEFKTKYKLDARDNNKAMVRLRQGVERLKKALALGCDATMNLECWMNDTDVSSKMTRDQFDAIYTPVRAKIMTCVAACLGNSGVTKESLASVEVVGGSLRLSALLDDLTKAFGRPLGRTLNMEECVARGCALQVCCL